MRGSKAAFSLVLTALFMVSETHAEGWGRIVSGGAGAIAGAYIARRAGGGTYAQIGASVLGDLLAERAYDAYANPGRVTISEGQGDYEPVYASPPVSFQASAEDLQKEYVEFRTRNETVFNKAKAGLIEKIKALKNQEPSPAWICATVCSGFDGQSLKATPIAAGADSAQEAYDQLNDVKTCPKGYVFSDGLAETAQGTRGLSLQESQLVCFPNALSVENTIKGINGTNQNARFRLSLIDVQVTSDGRETPSRKAVFEAMDQMNNPLTMMLISGQSTGADLKAKIESSNDLQNQLASFYNNLDNPQVLDNGTIVLDSKAGTPPPQRMHLTINRATGEVVMDLPLTTDHSCRAETGRMVVTTVVQVQNLETRPQPKDHLLEMNLQAAGYSDAMPDEFCK